jgi:hypothetical protein
MALPPRRPLAVSALRAEPPDARLPLAAAAVLVAVGLAQVGDFVTFVRMVSVAGIGAELNPVVARGAETLGFEALAAAKVALVALVASVFVVVARRHRRLAGFVATAATLAGLVGAFSNVLAIA